MKMSNQQNMFKYIAFGEYSVVNDILNSHGQTEGFINFKHCKSGDTFLIVAARHKQKDIVRLFIESGADIEQQNLDGKRALHESAANGCLNCTEMLLNAHADVDALKRGDWTPAMFACTKGHLDVLKLLVCHGADVRRVNKDGWNLFMLASREGHVDILHYLMILYPDTCTKASYNGRNALHTSCMHGQLSVVKFILSQCKIPVNGADACGTTPLMDALRFGHINIADLLIMTKADLNCEDKVGNMAIHISAQSGCIESVDFLLNRYSVDVNQCSKTSGLLPIHCAAKEGHINMVHYLLEQNSFLNNQDSYGRTALHLAVGANQIETVKYFLRLPKIVAVCEDNCGKKPIDYAMTLQMKTLFGVL